jgi:hypothetical protein
MLSPAADGPGKPDGDGGSFGAAALGLAGLLLRAACIESIISV